MPIEINRNYCQVKFNYKFIRPLKPNISLPSQMSKHCKNSSFSGIPLKQPPKTSILLNSLLNNKQNTNKSTSIKQSIQKTQSTNLKRLRTQTNIKPSTTFNIRNVSTHASASRYCSMKPPLKYQQELQKQLISDQHDRQLSEQRSKYCEGYKPRVSSNLEKIKMKLRQQFEVLSTDEKEASENKLNDEGQDRVSYADKVEQFLQSETHKFVQQSIRKHRKSKMLNKKKQKQKSVNTAYY